MAPPSLLGRSPPNWRPVADALTVGAFTGDFVPTFLGAIDQGTSSTRFIVFDESTRIVAESQHRTRADLSAAWMGRARSGRNLAQHADGHRRRAAQRRAAARDLAAIGITNQRETTVVWDRRTGVPLYNALVWQDTRVTEYLPTFTRDRRPSSFARAPACRSSSYFSSLKIRWILDHVPGARALAGAGRRAVRNHRHVPGLAAHRRAARRPARHRCDQRQPHPADAPRHARLGRRAARRLRHPACDAAGDPLEQRALRHGDRRSASTACRSPGILGDQQAALVGQTCFRPARPRTPTAPAASCC